jgi:hypothetical protein
MDFRPSGEGITKRLVTQRSLAEREKIPRFTCAAVAVRNATVNNIAVIARRRGVIAPKVYAGRDPALVESWLTGSILFSMMCGR